jgi:5-formyltetrahydrofolate cyclo-ligase
MSYKYKLRNQFKLIRQNIPADYRELAAKQAAALFVNHALFKNSERIACYLPFKDEFNSLPLIDAIWQHKKKCYLPVLSANEDKILHFVSYKYGDALHRNRLGFLEPVHVAHEMEASALDIMIKPLHSRLRII